MREQMREIKFRVYDILKKVYIIRDDLVLHLYDDSICYNERGNLIKVPENRIVLEQYTGLKDKNGVEIYEGDILNFYGKYNGKIVYRIGSFFFEEKTGRRTPLYMYNPIDSEVIGNIHDKENHNGSL